MHLRRVAGGLNPLWVRRIGSLDLAHGNGLSGEWLTELYTDRLIRIMANSILTAYINDDRSSLHPPVFPLARQGMPVGRKRPFVHVTLQGLPSGILELIMYPGTFFFRSGTVASCTLLAALMLGISPAVAGQEVHNTAETDEAVWIDVRSAEEFAAGHVGRAVHIPHTEIVSGVSALGLEKNRQIYLYCRTGRRAGLALDALRDQGYTQVSNAGGFHEAMQTAGQAADASAPPVEDTGSVEPH